MWSALARPHARRATARPEGREAGSGGRSRWPGSLRRNEVRCPIDRTRRALRYRPGTRNRPSDIGGKSGGRLPHRAPGGCGPNTAKERRPRCRLDRKRVETHTGPARQGGLWAARNALPDPAPGGRFSSPLRAPWSEALASSPSRPRGGDARARDSQAARATADSHTHQLAAPCPGTHVIAMSLDGYGAPANDRLSAA